jgi:Fe-S-cluster-containing dehydrogenase component
MMACPYEARTFNKEQKERANILVFGFEVLKNLQHKF